MPPREARPSSRPGPGLSASKLPVAPAATALQGVTIGVAEPAAKMMASTPPATSTQDLKPGWQPAPVPAAGLPVAVDPLAASAAVAAAMQGIVIKPAYPEHVSRATKKANAARERADYLRLHPTPPENIARNKANRQIAKAKRDADRAARDAAAAAACDAAEAGDDADAGGGTGVDGDIGDDAGDATEAGDGDAAHSDAASAGDPAEVAATADYAGAGDSEAGGGNAAK